MYRKILLSSVWLMLTLIGSAYAQSYSITGIVTDEDGKPLPGASVILLNTDRGAATDVFGKYAIHNVKQGDYELEASFVGYIAEKKQVKIDESPNTRVVFSLAENDMVLGEIVVQNEKFVRNLQETVTSISVIDADQIDAMAIRDWREAGRLIGNFNPDPLGGFSIRGISNAGVGYGGQGSTAQFYIDGIAQSGIATRYGARGMWDVEALEVFRGPQSTVSGRNALAGSVYMRSKDPAFKWGGAARLTGGNQSNREAALAITGPLVEDQLAFRVSGEYQFLDTGFRFTSIEALDLDGTKDLVESEYANVKGRLLFTPAVLPQLSARLALSYTSDRPTLLLEATGPDFSARESSAPYASLEEGDVYNASFELGYDLNAFMTLTSLSAYHHGGRDRDGLKYVDPNPELIIPVGQKGEFDTRDFTQELRLNIEYDQLEAVIGGYYGKFDADNVGQNLGDVFPIVQPLIEQTVGGPVPPAEILYDLDFVFNTVSDNQALFGELNYELPVGLRITAGLRYDHEDFEQSSVSVAEISADPNAFGPLTEPILDALRERVQEPDTNPSTSYDALLPKFGLSYKINKDITVGTTIQRGYRSGGAQILATGDLNVYDPEYTLNYEASLRTRWLDGRLTANVNAFYTDWQDQQLNVVIEGTSLVRVANAGSSTLYGIETEIRAIPTSGLMVFGSLGLVESEFQEFTLDGRDLKGYSFPNSARETYSIGFNYEARKGALAGFFATADVSYTGKYFSAVGTGPEGINDPDLQGGDYTLVNGRVGYTFNWQGREAGVSVFARNLFDEDAILNAGNGGFGGRVVQYGLPRVVGVTLDIEF